MNRQKQTNAPGGRRISLAQQTEGAMLAVVAAILALASNIPFLDMVLMFFSPVPIVLAAVRHGIRLCLITTFLCTVLLLLVMGPMQAAMFFLASGSIGAVIGILARIRPRPVILLLSGILMMVVVQYMSLYAVAPLVGIDDPMKEMSRGIHEGFDYAGKMMTYVAAPPKEGPDPLVEMENMVRTMDALLLKPLFLFFSAGFVYFILHYRINTWVLGRMGERMPPLPEFHRWRLPPFFAFILILPWFTPIAPGTSPASMPWLLNILFLSRFICDVVGLAAVAHFLNKRKIPAAAGLPFYIALFACFEPVLFFLGLFDTLGAWRDEHGE